jgi:hypothetical protein
VFWTSEDIEVAQVFARANPAGAEGAIVRIRLQVGIKAAMRAGILKPVQLGYKVTNWLGFNKLAQYDIAEMVGEEP